MMKDRSKRNWCTYHPIWYMLICQGRSSSLLYQTMAAFADFDEHFNVTIV
jgi:hypothetical protein